MKDGLWRHEQGFPRYICADTQCHAVLHACANVWLHRAQDDGERNHVDVVAETMKLLDTASRGGISYCVCNTRSFSPCIQKGERDIRESMGGELCITSGTTLKAVTVVRPSF